MADRQRALAMGVAPPIAFIVDSQWSAIRNCVIKLWDRRYDHRKIGLRLCKSPSLKL